MQTIQVGQILTGTVVGLSDNGNIQPLHGLSVSVTEPSIVTVAIDNTDADHPKIKATGVAPGSTHVIISAMNSENVNLISTEDFNVVVQVTATYLSVTWE